MLHIIIEMLTFRKAVLLLEWLQGKLIMHMRNYQVSMIHKGLRETLQHTKLTNPRHHRLWYKLSKKLNFLKKVIFEIETPNSK